LIIPNTLVLLARIIVQVSASKASVTMTARTHQQQVFLQVSSVVDFKLMPFPFCTKANFFTDICILVGIWGSLYEKSHLLALTEFRGMKVLKGPMVADPHPAPKRQLSVRSGHTGRNSVLPGWVVLGITAAANIRNPCTSSIDRKFSVLD